MPATSDEEDAARRLERERTIVASLIAPPPWPGDIVARNRLFDRLDQATGRPLTIVSGEPASGKTSLVLDWIRSGRASDRTIAWLTVPRHLNDPVLFWRYLLAAVEPLGTPVDDLEDALADGPPDDNWLTVFANRMVRVPGDPLVVIDDFHEIDDEQVLGSFETLSERSTVPVVLLTRVKPPWALAPMRVAGRLDEIDSADLRFTLAEARGLVDLTDGPGLTDDDIELLVGRTEGWAGGIKLALMSMRRADDAAGFLARFAADDELVSSYLFREVLEREDAEVRAFIVDASILEFIDAEICDDVRERGDSEGLLERCRTENLFLTQLATPGSFRLHPLFAQLLQATLEVEDPDRFVRLHRRASVAFERRGDLRWAVAHAIAGRDDARTGQLIARHASGLAHQDRFDEIRSWLSLLPRHPGAVLPETTMGLVSTMSLIGRCDEALDLLDDLEHQDVPPRMRYEASQLRGFALMADGRVDALGPVVAALRRPVPEGETTLPFDPVRLAAYLAGVAGYFEGDLPRARSACTEAATRAERPGIFYVESPGWLARVAVEEGRLTEAERHARTSLDRRDEMGSGETAVAVPALLALADVAWERDELGECEQRIDQARRAVRPLLWETVLVELSASRLHASRNELELARADLDEIGRVYLTGTSAPSLRALVAERSIDLALRAGDVDDALRWEKTFATTSGRALPPALRLRMTEATSAPTGAAQIAGAVDEERTVPARIDVLIVAAMLTERAGDHARALELVGTATALAEPERFLRRFADAGPEVGSALEELLVPVAPATSIDVVASPFTLGLLTSAIRGPAVEQCRRPGPSADLVDPLTDRELQVLDRLLAGDSYSAIGAELYVSRNTVKSHVRHVYTKLGVASRGAAADEARRLGLV